MSKKIKVAIVICLLVILSVTIALVLFIKNDTEVKTVKSDKELMKIYEGDDELLPEILQYMSMPPLLMVIYNQATNITNGQQMSEVELTNSQGTEMTDSLKTSSNNSDSNFEKKEEDYSRTNTQEENVDEADIIKTDGKYIYSISDNKVIITDAQDPTNIQKIAEIKSDESASPVDLIINDDRLVVISEELIDNNSNYYNNKNTIVEVYDTTKKEEPYIIKDYKLCEPYYTSRCIGNKLYVISSGRLRKENDKIQRDYVEEGQTKEIELNNIKYLKNKKTDYQTLISSIDINNKNDKLQINSYLMNVENAYVSENSIYLMDDEYDYNPNMKENIKLLFGLGGLPKFFDEIDDLYFDSGYKTNIMKFDIGEGKIKYVGKNEVEGRTINQYSLDEKNGHLRIALYDDKGTRIIILNDKLQEIGRTDDLAEGERMYSSRFMDDKVYLVTYKQVDPLFVVDLSNEYKPQVLGKLKIPGYSTYLHPYDDNHIIGIGMQTQSITNKDLSGRVQSTSTRVTGMKMALFDVSNVQSPKQMSETIIGDSRTTSAILTNPKALLFSKEKELIAIPVNNYNTDFQVQTSDTISGLINNYTSYSNKNNRISEGYLVYNINLTDGFKLKGSITHEVNNRNNNYYFYNYTRLLRGLYIGNNLYTVSETEIKVNDLNTMEQIGGMKLEKAKDKE